MLESILVVTVLVLDLGDTETAYREQLEYQSFFGRLYNRFKTAYLVKFDAKDIQGNCLLCSDADAIKLCFRKLGRQAFLTWNLDEQGNCRQELNARMVKRSYEYYC